MDGWFRVGELARRTGLTVRTLHHYDAIGLLVPSGRSSGDYRLYGRDDLRRLLQIQQLKALGLSLDQIAAALRDPAATATELIRRRADELEQRISAEQELLTRLRRLQAQPDADWDDVLATIALTERLGDPDPTVRLRAALDAPTSAPLDELLDALAAEPQDAVRETLTWAVVQHGVAATDQLLDRLDDPDPTARLHYAHALSKLRSPEAVPALARLTEDPDDAVRAKAAFALGQIGGSLAVAALVPQLGHGDAMFRDTVTTALGKQGATAVPALVGRLADSRPDVRAQLADVLGEIADPATVAPLAQLAEDAVVDVRLSALMALDALGTDAARDALRRARESADPQTRRLAQHLAGEA